MMQIKVVGQRDLVVVSAALQDAIISVRDLAFLEDQQQFQAVFNRFMWERVARRPWMRVMAALRVDHVTGATANKIDFRDKDRLLCFLALHWHDPSIDRAGQGELPGMPGKVPQINHAGQLVFTFAAEQTITLEVNRLSLRVRDNGEPWPTDQKPRHDSTDLDDED
ncbi:MAG: DUF2948 family protein [Pseudomonadota bacterium]